MIVPSHLQHCICGQTFHEGCDPSIEVEVEGIRVPNHCQGEGLAKENWERSIGHFQRVVVVVVKGYHTSHSMFGGGSWCHS